MVKKTEKFSATGMAALWLGINKTLEWYNCMNANRIDIDFMSRAFMNSKFMGGKWVRYFLVSI